MLHKTTLHRPIQRRKNNESSWAISYADFLMVLLSFFIMFFSVDKKSILHQLVIGLHDTAIDVSEKPASELKNTHVEVKVSTINMESLAKAIPMAHLSKDVGGSPRIEIVLPDNLYSLGKFNAPKKELSTLVGPLKKFEDKISIVIIGHSDGVGFQENNPVIKKNNTTLASVRAAYASIYLQEQLPKSEIATQTLSNSSRSTRSLTLYVEEKKVVP